MMSIIHSIASPTSMLYWLNLVVVGILISAISLVLLKVLQNRSEVFRHAFVVVSLLVLLVTPLAVWVGSHSQLGLLTIKSPQPSQAPSPLPPESPADILLPWEELAASPDVTDQAAAGTGIVNDLQEETHVAAASPARVGADIPWRQVGFCLLLVTWCLGTVWFVAQTMRGGMMIRRHLRLSTPITEGFILDTSQSAARKVGLAKLPPVLKSNLVPVPVSTGVCYSAVILPEDFLRDASRDELEAVLMHEFAHIMRRDHWVGLVQRLTVALFWWNPLVHRISRLCSALAEEICDDYATESLESGEDFARTLLAMAERVAKHLDIPLAIEILPAKRHDLERRIARLMQKERRMNIRLSLNHLALVSLFALLVTGTTVLSTVWADSRVDAPANNAGSEAVAVNEEGVESPSPHDDTGKANSPEETSSEQPVAAQEASEKNGAISNPAGGNILPGRNLARSQTTLRLLKEGAGWWLPRLAPDELKIARSDPNYQIIIVSDLTTGVEQTYELSGIVFSFVWSPDSRRLAFVHSMSAEWTDTTDWRVGILTLDSGDVEKTDIRALPCDWSGDGRFLLAVDLRDDEESNGLQLVDLKTGEAKTVFRPFTPFRSSLPRLSPDGRHVVYDEKEKEDVYDIYVQPMDSNERIHVASHKGGGPYPLWSPDGRHILFLSDVKSWRPDLNAIAWRSDILSMALQDGRPIGEREIVVKNMGNGVRLFSCSNSGSLLFSESWRRDIYSAKTDPVTGSVLGKPEQLTKSKFGAHWPVWSPNGKYLAYDETTASGDRLLRVMNSDGRNKRTLGRVNFLRKASKVWHPDNEHVLYAGREADPENQGETQDGIYSVSVRTHARRLIYSDPGFQGDMHVSPDGRHLALTLGSQQNPQLFIVDTNGQNRRLLVKADGVIAKPTFTPDGKEIIYTFTRSVEGKKNRNSIMAVPVKGGEPRLIYASEDPNDGYDTRPSSWLPDGRYVFDIMHVDGRPQYAIDMDGKSDPVRISDSMGGTAYSISPDGTKSVFSGVTRAPRLWLMSDFLPDE